MDLINFKVGDKTISLKILDILLTERFNDNLTELPNNNKSFIGVKEYMNTPTPIFDLGIILNGLSTEQSNTASLELLRNWQTKFLRWFEEIECNLAEHKRPSMNNEFKPHDFELFYTQFKTDNEELQHTISKFDLAFKPLLKKIMVIFEANNNNENDKKIASAQFEELKRHDLNQLDRLFDSAKEQISLEYKPIIVFTTTDGVNPHVGLLVDKVEDNIDYKQEDIKPLNKLTDVGFDIDPQTKNMMHGLIKLANKHSVLIDPKAIFKPHNLTAKINHDTTTHESH